MNLWNRIKGIFRRDASAPEGEKTESGFFGRLKQRRAERKRKKEYRRSQRRMEKMERTEQKRQDESKRQRQKEEQFAKWQAEQEERHRDQKARKTFKERWGFSDKEYEGFVGFIASIPKQYVEQVGSDTIVEVFRSGVEMGLTSHDMQIVVRDTIENMQVHQFVYAEDVIDDLYTNMQGYAQNVKAKGTTL